MMRHIPEPATLILLPGLDGTDVFFRPLLAALPQWISPIVVQYPPAGVNRLPDARSLGAQRVGGDPRSLSLRSVVCGTAGTNGRQRRAEQNSGRDSSLLVRQSPQTNLRQIAVARGHAGNLDHSSVPENPGLGFTTAGGSAQTR